MGGVPEFCVPPTSAHRRHMWAVKDAGADGKSAFKAAHYSSHVRPDEVSVEAHKFQPLLIGLKNPALLRPADPFHIVSATCCVDH